MAKETIYVVQTWGAGKRGQLIADSPMLMTVEDAAVRRAYRLEEEKAAVMVFAQTSDSETGEYDEPRIILRLGLEVDVE